MSQPSTTRRGHWGKKLAATIVMGLTVAGPAMAHGPHPATPCPCAADGTCYPKRDTWGFYRTNWRPAPGDNVGRTPTPAGQMDPQEIQRELPHLVRPLPEQEDLRGPAKPTRPSVTTDVNDVPAAGGQPPAGGQQPPAGNQLPGEEGEAAPAEAQPFDGLDLPGFGPQGSFQSLPQIEDAPPALPTNLNKALTALPSTSTTTRTTVVANPVRPAVSTLPVATSNYVTPATNVQGIELSNPAARNVQKTMDQSLEQAIYLEASDLQAQ
jgi:hypothetical protein